LDASSRSFRKNSNSEPCHWFVPDFVMALMATPLPPNCAL
jgi:hypothetical protein